MEIKPMDGRVLSMSLVSIFNWGFIQLWYWCGRSSGNMPSLLVSPHGAVSSLRGLDIYTELRPALPFASWADKGPSFTLHGQVVFELLDFGQPTCENMSRDEFSQPWLVSPSWCRASNEKLTCTTIRAGWEKIFANNIISQGAYV